MTETPRQTRHAGPTRGLVLSGGGARGAYEAGVIDYMFSELPHELLAKSRIHIYCGTSVGAIHACYLAATAHLPRHEVSRLLDMWRNLRVEQMLRLNLKDLLRLPGDVRALFSQARTPPGVIVNARHLREVVMNDMPWDCIHQNLEQGLFDALTVTATHIASGKTINFVERFDGGVPPWTRDKRVMAQAVRIGPQHALASAAIPFLFPAVQVDGYYLCDGGLRQNTPLSPALRLGVDRVLVIGLRHEGANGRTGLQNPAEENYPGPFLMMGKVLDALLLDHLDYDIARLEGFNTLLRDGRLAFGEGFEERINTISQRMRGTSYREVNAVTIRPSRDIGEMATEFVFIHKPRLGKVQGYLLGKVAASDFLAHSDFLSYLLFDGRFAEALIALGRADADASRDKLIEFFKD